MAFDVTFYRDAKGRCPFIDFLDGLPPKMRAKVARDLGLLEANGPSLREPISKPLGEGIFELRSKFGSDIVESLYFFLAGKMTIVTSWFIKKSRKTPTNEIDLAISRRADWIERRHDGE